MAATIRRRLSSFSQTVLRTNRIIDPGNELDGNGLTSQPAPEGPLESEQTQTLGQDDAVPAYSVSAPPLSGDKYSDLDMHLKDLIFTWQMQQENPQVLHEYAFYLGKVVARTKQANRVYTALQSLGVISPIPSANPRIHTSQITGSFRHEMAFLASSAQRQLVNILFFWESERQRLQQHDSQIEDLQVMQAQWQSSDSLSEEERTSRVQETKVRIAALNATKAQAPGARHDPFRQNSLASLPVYS